MYPGMNSAYSAVLENRCDEEEKLHLRTSSTFFKRIMMSCEIEIFRRKSWHFTKLSLKLRSRRYETHGFSITPTCLRTHLRLISHLSQTDHDISIYLSTDT